MKLQLVPPVFGMGLLSFAMFFWMSLTRLPAMKRAGLTLADAAHTEDLRPRLDAAGRRRRTITTTCSRRRWSSMPWPWRSSSRGSPIRCSRWRHGKRESQDSKREARSCKPEG
jgi:hypothetical protein